MADLSLALADDSWERRAGCRSRSGVLVGGRREPRCRLDGCWSRSAAMALPPERLVPSRGRDGCRPHLATLFREAMSVPTAARTGPAAGATTTSSQAIGNTPLVELQRLSPKPGVRIWAKLESRNPTGSVKDRVAKRDDRGRRGQGPDQARPDDPRADLGQHRDLARDDLLAQGLHAQGRDAGQRHARAHPAAEDVRRRDRLLAAATRAPTAPSRWRSRWPRPTPRTTCPTSTGTRPTRARTTTARRVEILEELDGRSPRSSPGLGHRRHADGPRAGASRRSSATRVKIVAAEPMQGEPVQGLRSLDDGFIPPIIDLSLLDRKIFVTNRDAIIWTRKLLDEEGLFAGVSSGAIARDRASASRARWTRATSSSSSATTAGSTSRSGDLHAAGRRGREPRLHRVVVARPPIVQRSVVSQPRKGVP